MALVRSAHRHASSSSTTTGFSQCGFDVFLSFRGEDTRKTFTDHLYTAFDDAGFRTFRDDELERGEDIKPGLKKAIQQSRSSVIVFSKDYASSGWCLDELVMILECKRTSRHIVLPVFYHVDPSEVRKQTGSFAEAFALHELNPLRKYKVKTWRAALTQSADLAGMVLQNHADGHESKFIKKVVKVIEGKLSRPQLSVAPHVIAIHSQVEKINSWVQDGSTDVGILAICGMRGIGKTTIAKIVYNLNSKCFQGSSFLENMKELSEQPNGLVQLQMQLVSDVLNGRKKEIHNVSEGMIKIQDAIRSKRILLVVDDVDHIDQFDVILTMRDQFYPGSKVILTTSHGGLLKPQQAITVHEVKTFGYSEALELFSWHAFGQDHPTEGYTEHAERVAYHCAGLLLALKVFSSSLSGQSIAVWKDALDKLEAIPDGGILKKLKISYDSLQDDHDRNLFLHIACFFVGKDQNAVVNILDGCGFYPVVGIQNLIDRCLVTIDTHKVQMHDMIRDMGRGIVRLESEEPGERSRLWYHRDCIGVLTEHTGTKTIKGLVLNMERNPAYELVLETKAFSRMLNLRLLQLSSHVQFKGGYEEFPRGLRWLCWLECPLDSLPSGFPLGSLVVLEICHGSSLRLVWKGTNNVC